MYVLGIIKLTLLQRHIVEILVQLLDKDACEGALHIEMAPHGHCHLFAAILLVDQQQVQYEILAMQGVQTVVAIQ